MEWKNYWLLFKVLLLSITISLIIISCKKSGQPTPASPDTTTIKPVVIIPDRDIYVAGSVFTGASNQSTATYWKNGVATSLTATGIISTATAIYIAANNDVYVAGSMLLNGFNKAVYWKNGTAVVLDNGCATGIVVSGTDVYVSGYTDIYPPNINYNATPAATYWKNGTATFLTNSLIGTSYGNNYINSMAESIALQGSNVYIAGWGSDAAIGGQSEAICWKNGQPTILVNFYGAGWGALNGISQAFGIYINGTDVYIAGYVFPATGSLATPQTVSNAVYWLNNVGHQVFTNVAAHQYANCIAVKDTNVYVAGFNGFNDVYYSKNGVGSSLSMSGTSSHTTGIALYNGDVYVSGYSIDAINQTGPAGYWKNGVAVLLATTSAKATAIAVVKHQ